MTNGAGKHHRPHGASAPAQLSLFDESAACSEADAPEREFRLVTLADMPEYLAELQQAVDRSMQALPAAKLWFTYRDIRLSFGVSRATIARRLRDGLVPGVMMAGDSVVEEGPVRRFDRDQLRWLLLALRCRRGQEEFGRPLTRMMRSRAGDATARQGSGPRRFAPRNNAPPRCARGAALAT